MSGTVLNVFSNLFEKAILWPASILVPFMVSTPAMGNDTKADFVTPLVLDLDQNHKLDLLSPFDLVVRVHFSFTGDNFKPRTGWVQKSDGFLALDANGNGMIDNGTELFGPYTQAEKRSESGFFKDGFEALAHFDRDSQDKADGKIDRQDIIFDKLLIWQDLNADGISQKEELKTLAATGIKDILLKKRKVSPSESLYRNTDNEIRLIGTYRTHSGKSWPIADVWFKQRHLEL